MRRTLPPLLLTLAMLSPSPPARAADPGSNPGASPGPSFDCARATKAAEKFICADPGLTALDHAVARAYATALAKAGTSAPLLRGEQRRWLTYRDQIGDRSLWRYPPPAAEIIQDLRATLTRRAAALRRVADDGYAADAPGLCARAAATLAAIPADDPAFQQPLLDRLREAGLVADQPPTHGIAPHWREALGLKADEWNGGAGVVSFGPQGDHVAAYQVEGTAECADFKIFHKNGGDHYTPVPPPPDKRQGAFCWNDTVTFATALGRAAFVEQITQADRERLTIQLANDQPATATRVPWGDSCAIDVRYRMAYRVGAVGCADSAICAALRRQGPAWAQAVTAWDEQGPADYPALPGLDIPTDRALPPHTVGLEVPRLAGFQPSAYPAFADAAPWRLWQAPDGSGSQPLLVLVSHPHLGWRTTADVLIGVWRVVDGALVPVAGAEMRDTRLAATIKTVTASPTSHE